MKLILSSMLVVLVSGCAFLSPTEVRSPAAPDWFDQFLKRRSDWQTVENHNQQKVARKGQQILFYSRSCQIPATREISDENSLEPMAIFEGLNLENKILEDQGNAKGKSFTQKFIESPSADILHRQYTGGRCIVDIGLISRTKPLKDRQGFVEFYQLWERSP